MYFGVHDRITGMILIAFRFENQKSIDQAVAGSVFFICRNLKQVNLLRFLQIKKPGIAELFWFICDRDRIRTYDRLLRRQMLYPAELRDPLLDCFKRVQI